MRLITKEDPYHIHKTFGIYCMCNFIYQTYLFFTSEMILNTIILVPHICLPLTSLFFKVLSHRPKIKTMKMFIWKELQLHAIIFSLRSIFTIIFPQIRIFIVFITMLFADLATNKYGSDGMSTVRGKQSKTGSRPLLLELQSAFFSTSQLGATIICSGLFQEHISPELIFLTLPPIQSSAFGMTLIRKNIINKNIWSIVYSIELLLVYFGWYYLNGDILLVPYSIITYLLRRFIFTNKYLMWFTIFFTEYLINNNYLQLI